MSSGTEKVDSSSSSSSHSGRSSRSVIADTPKAQQQQQHLDNNSEKPLQSNLQVANTSEANASGYHDAVSAADVSYRGGYDNTVDDENLDLELARTSTSAASETQARINRQLSKILSGSENEPDKDHVDYTGCPPMGGGRPFPPAPPDRGPYEVTFEGTDDPTHPYNWPSRKKTIISIILGLNSIGVAMGSSIFASAVTQVSEDYHVATIVAILGVTLFVFGFAASPVIYAPLSELYGRQGMLIVSSFGYTLFQFAVATGENLQTILICRFFGGFIGAAPLAIVPAAFFDMYDNEHRGSAVTIFALGVFVGPIMAPVFGSYIVQYTTWRWTEYVTGIYAGLVTLLIAFYYEETHHPTILVRKARMMRQKTGNWAIHAAHEDAQLSIKEIAEKTVTRPIRMLFTEPILFCITLYHSFVYGILYLLLEAYPIVFQGKYGYLKNGELPYIALIIGMLVNAMYNIYGERGYVAQVRANDGKPIPEARLKPMILAGIVFPIGILWFCWTGNYPDKVHFMVPTVAGSFIGFGLIGIFLPCFNYLIDSYLILSASAIAGNTFMRSAFGASFPLFAGYMFNGMGVNWAGLLLGLFAFAMVPVPLLLLKYGRYLRGKSKYAFVL